VVEDVELSLILFDLTLDLIDLILDGENALMQ